MKLQFSRLALGLVTLVALSPAFAERLNPVTREGAIETEAGLVSFSGGSNGTLSVRACLTCELQTYRMDARTVYVVGRKAVTQSVWESQTRALPKANSVVFFRLSDNIVSRVVVSG